MPWLPRRGGRVPLAADLAAIARTGTWPPGRYAGRSQARMAVITAAVACGWQLAEVRAELDTGRWPGLAGGRPEYARKGPQLVQSQVSGFGGSEG